MDTFFQDFQGLADLVPYRIDGQIQLLGDLLVFESVTFAEDKDLTAFFRKTIDCRPHTSFSLCPLLSVVIVDDSVGVVWLEGFCRDAFLTKMVQSMVSHHHI